jgi:acyl-coenzyme A thioesterase PaaI-like protein
MSVVNLSAEILDILKRKFGDRINQYAFPPPIFLEMQGVFLELDLDAGYLSTQFPVLENYLNPYGTMQGGMLAAAVDNTLGPLSVLVAPPNVTRRLEMKYSQPATLDKEYIIVNARLLERKDRRLFFQAKVFDQQGQRLASSKAVHWIIDEIGDDDGAVP